MSKRLVALTVLVVALAVGPMLSARAKAAIASGDIVWIEKRCGKLAPEERAWLTQRLEAEIW